jgi:hypothetical protein
MSDDQDIAQTLLLTLTEAERIRTAMGQAKLLKEDLALVRGTLDSARRNGRAELLVVIKKDIYDTAPSEPESEPDERGRASASTDLDQMRPGPGRQRGRTSGRGS